MAETDGGPTSEPFGSASTRTSAPDGPASGDAPPVFSVGDQLAGRFRIVRFIARGGMGEIYEAEDFDLGENVALKTVRLAGHDAHALERFRSEIQLARRVTHPNVCRTFDVFHHRPAPGTAEGEITFLSMELLRGETLADRLRRSGRLPRGEALALGRQMAAALDAAHRAGVVHRDFKSRNVVLVPGEEGERAVVSDFGLARSAPGPSGSTTSVTDAVVGTPDYMAPEQVYRNEIDQRTDVFNLGATLYWVLTGKWFKTMMSLVPVGSNKIALEAHRGNAPPREINPRIPLPLSRLTMDCCASSKGQRPRDMREVISRLEVVQHLLERAAAVRRRRTGRARHRH